ncbi:unnamed protein product [Cuscuta europaea]|uniref:SWIM-type domain-containing protein n=2 Tax=Cuscuta europaea TaxID=41803 RepID=A0A9P0YXS8_CUSEU|nr:unnamed protein product [Cuscuta europaea]
MNLKKLFWQCAKSTCEPQLEANLAELDKADAQAGIDLRKHPFKLWCKAFFRDAVKCDTVENNLSEAFNSTLLKARSKPLIPMLEDIRVATMKRIAKKRKYVLKWPGSFGPIIMKKLNTNILASQGWNVDFNGDDGYEIKKGRGQFKVSLKKRSCSCRRWDLSGIPCAHAICAIYDKGEEAEAYVDHCYSKEMYQKTYSYTLHPINGELLWPRTQHEEILPPFPKKMSGRPKKKRVREQSEARPPSSSQLSRKGRIMTCSLCGGEGHNKKSCSTTAGTVTPSARGRRPRGGRGKRGGNTSRRQSGVGVYVDEATGETILEPGETVIGEQQEGLL